MKKFKLHPFLSNLAFTFLMMGIIFFLSLGTVLANDEAKKEEKQEAPRTGLNKFAPDAPLPKEKEGTTKLLPGEPEEPTPDSWGYDAKTGIFTHPAATPDNEGPQPFEGSLPYLDQNQYTKNMNVEAFYPYVIGWGHSWQATFDLDGRRYLYDLETDMYNVFDITDPKNAKRIANKLIDTDKGDKRFGPMTVKYNKKLDKTIAVQCYEVPRYGVLSNKYEYPEQVKAIKEKEMLRGFRIFEVTSPLFSEWNLLSETPLDAKANASDLVQEGSGCQDVPVYDGGDYLFVAGAPDDSFINTEYKSYLYSGAQMAFDISDPSNPKRLSTWWVPGQRVGEEEAYNKNPRAGNKTTWMGARMPLFIPTPVEKGGKYGYAAMGGFGFYIVDISDPANMKTVSHIEMPMSVSGTEGDNIDVSKVESTGIVYYSGYPLSEDCHEPYKEIYAIDVNDPLQPKIISTLKRPTPPESAPFTDFCQRRGSFGPKRSGYATINPGVPSDQYIPYAFYNAGVQIFDVTNPTESTIEAYFVPKMSGEIPNEDGTTTTSDHSNPVHGIFVEWDRNLIWAFSNHGMYVLSTPLLGDPVIGLPKPVEEKIQTQKSKK
ncbi:MULTISPECIES: LVIVD repeat-containing protein [unclassified Lysinibacillus]|uniref:LVIVD repeat-containing protein n=1 Tax=unclassified Lysinibacillus TaxID=2636778 RepID=UPI0037F61B71